MEPDRLHQAVDVLEELPGEARLADPGRADHRDQAGALLAAGGVEELLQEAQVVVAADEWGLERLGPVAAAAFGDHAQGAPGLDRRLLALEDLLAGRLEDDRPAGRALGGLADEDGARLGGRLEAAGGVDQVARDHALVRGADRDGGFAGQDAGPGLDRGAEGLDRVDELHRGPDGSFGVVFVGGWRAPDGHHGVADELLDRAAVAIHDVAGQVEVAGQELAGLLGIAAFGQGGEAHEIGEQDR